MNVSECGRVLGWAQFVTEALRGKAAFTLPLEEMTDAGWAEGKEGMNKLLSSLIFKASHRRDRWIRLEAHSLPKWAFFFILTYIEQQIALWLMNVRGTDLNLSLKQRQIYFHFLD